MQTRRKNFFTSILENNWVTQKNVDLNSSSPHQRRRYHYCLLSLSSFLVFFLSFNILLFKNSFFPFSRMLLDLFTTFSSRPISSTKVWPDRSRLFHCDPTSTTSPAVWTKSSSWWRWISIFYIIMSPFLLVIREINTRCSFSNFLTISLVYFLLQKSRLEMNGTCIVSVVCLSYTP